MKEQILKERLMNVFNAMMNLEVKGQGVIIVADCLRELQDCINTPIEKEEECTE